MTIATFEDVIAWQKARKFYIGLCRDLSPKTSNFYRDQILRATLSISNNIAEGLDRGSKKELKQFLIIARGSADEIRSMLLIAKDLNVLASEKNEQHLKTAKDISKLLTGFIKSLQTTDYRKRITKQ